MRQTRLTRRHAMRDLRVNLDAARFLALRGRASNDLRRARIALAALLNELRDARIESPGVLSRDLSDRITAAIQRHDEAIRAIGITW